MVVVARRRDLDNLGSYCAVDRLESAQQSSGARRIARALMRSARLISGRSRSLKLTTKRPEQCEPKKAGMACVGVVEVSRVRRP